MDEHMRKRVPPREHSSKKYPRKNDHPQHSAMVSFKKTAEQHRAQEQKHMYYNVKQRCTNINPNIGGRHFQSDVRSFCSHQLKEHYRVARNNMKAGTI